MPVVGWFVGWLSGSLCTQVKSRLSQRAGMQVQVYVLKITKTAHSGTVKISPKLEWLHLTFTPTKLLKGGSRRWTPTNIAKAKAL